MDQEIPYSQCCSVRMLGTFNQHLPIVLSKNVCSQRKPTSLLDTGMGVVPYFSAAEREILCKSDHRRLSSGRVKCLESTEVSYNM